MKVSYNRLWKLLIDRGMKKTELMEAAGLTSNTITKMGKNEMVSMKSLVKICGVLDCDIGDVVEVCREGD